MSNIALIIEERAASIGSFLVGRLLPFVQKRAVGPFVFIDHMGPVNMDELTDFDVGPHPHIGLSTLTFLFDGAIMHRDSIGTEIEIQPGAVNWMSAGKGVVHSERTPDRLRGQNKSMHGLQIWVALPKELEKMEPEFHHIKAEDIPTWHEEGVQYKMIAGKALGKESPVPVHSNLYFIEIKNDTDEVKTIDIGDGLYGESALYILEGNIHTESQDYGNKQILIAHNTSLCAFDLLPHSAVYIFGGDPLPERRHIHWNFVATDKAIISEAVEKWKNQEFPKVPNETGYIPYPDK